MRIPLTTALLFVIAASTRVRADWPMLARDPARGGSTSDEIRPPFSRKWYRTFADEGLMSGVQPVIVGKSLYIGTLRGNLYAIDTETGKDRWVHRAGAPILHAAAATPQRVFFCAGDSVICAAASDGVERWRIRTGAALWNAPLVYNDLLLVGGRDSKLYAIDTNNGVIGWTAHVGGPILCSPAIDLEEQRAYVGSEDMHAYAFSLADGEQLWKSPKLPGVSFRGYHPVVAPDGSVMITVTPHAGGDAIQENLLEMVKEVFGNFSSWRIKSEEEKKRIRAENFELMKKPETYQRQLDYLRKRLTNEPALQTFFVLDPDTGRQKFVAPIVYAESMNGPASPPIVTPDGKVIVKYNALLRSRYEHYSPFLNVGYLDTTTGHITPVMDQSRTYGWHDSLLLVHDEQSQLAVAGNVLINTHQDNVNAMDLKTLDGYPEPFAHNVHEVNPGTATSIWAKHLSDEPLPMGWEWFPRGTAIYGGGSTIDAPVVVANDSFYFLPTHELNAGVVLIAYRMDKNGNASRRAPEPRQELTPQQGEKIKTLKWDWDMLAMPRLDHVLKKGLPEGTPPGTLTNPKRTEAAAAVEKIGDDLLDQIIWNDALPQAGAQQRAAPDRARHRDQLANAVEELIARDWHPLIFPAGKHPAQCYRIFIDPTETLYTLALAYPHLPRDLQAKVKSRVQQLREGPLKGPTGARTYFDSGEHRSAYTPAPPSLIRIENDLVRSDTARLYPLWLWAHVTDDWEPLKTDWPRLRDGIATRAIKDEFDLGNAQIAGLIAACRLAKRFGDDRALVSLLPQTRSVMRDRLRYELAHTNGGLITRPPTLRTIFGRWRHLTPDVARMLRLFARNTHQHLMDVYVDHHRPTWPLAWNVELLWRNETPFSFPTMSQEIFSARAMILNEPPDKLAPFIDLPWCKADEFHIQKLALVLSAQTDPRP